MVAREGATTLVKLKRKKKRLERKISKLFEKFHQQKTDEALVHLERLTWELQETQDLIDFFEECELIGEENGARS